MCYQSDTRVLFAVFVGEKKKSCTALQKVLKQSERRKNDTDVLQSYWDHKGHQSRATHCKQMTYQVKISRISWIYVACPIVQLQYTAYKIIKPISRSPPPQAWNCLILLPDNLAYYKVISRKKENLSANRKKGESLRHEIIKVFWNEDNGLICVIY